MGMLISRKRSNDNKKEITTFEVLKNNPRTKVDVPKNNFNNKGEVVANNATTQPKLKFKA